MGGDGYGLRRIRGASAHHAQLHNLAGPRITAGGAVGVARQDRQRPGAFGARTTLQGVTADQHHNKLHNVTDVTHHTTSGAPWDVVGKTAAGALGLLTPQDSVTSAQSALLRRSAGGSRSTSISPRAMCARRWWIQQQKSDASPAGSAVVPTGALSGFGRLQPQVAQPLCGGTLRGNAGCAGRAGHNRRAHYESRRRPNFWPISQRADHN